MKPGLGLVVLLGGFSCVSRADDCFASFLSNEGFYGFLAAGTLVSHDRDFTLRSADALATTYLLNRGLKDVFRVPRINGGASDSFPSGHTAGAFAVATMAAEADPKNTAWWYGGAALIGWSRVQTEAHRIPDVLAGAVVGWWVAKAELRSKSPFLLRFGGSGTEMVYYIRF
jgi:membrane-associated phospholipid phosphatase